MKMSKFHWNLIYSDINLYNQSNQNVLWESQLTPEMNHIIVFYFGNLASLNLFEMRKSRTGNETNYH